MEKGWLTKKVTEKLKSDWYSDTQLAIACGSSSAGRVMRAIRKNPPENYRIIQRKKNLPEGYSQCLEYKLIEIEKEN